MARLIGPSSGDRLAYTIPTTGTLKDVIKGKAGRPAKFYDDPDPTAEPTLSMLQDPADIRSLAGVPHPDSTVTIDPVSLLPLMQFPDGTPPPDSLLGQIDNGPPFRIYAREDDRIDALAASISTEASTRADADTAVIATAAADATSKANAAQSAATGAAAALAIVFGA